MSDELVLQLDPPYAGSAVSPTVDITETTTDVTVTITDFRGDHSYTVEKTDRAIADAEQAATNANTAAQYARDTADQAAADAQATADAAAGRADTAAGNANQAAQSANTAAGTANTSAQNADTKAALADSKAGLANQAATTANQAAQAAEAAKTAANTAAGQATTAAGNATAAAQTANTAAGNADAKAALADTAATNADTATQAANTATANANTATTAATNAAQAANNAAEYAIEAADDMPRLIGTVDTAQTVNDAWPTTMESAVLYGKSVQNGTPTPENPVEVQVVGGRNLLELPTWAEVLASEKTGDYRNYPIQMEPNTSYYLNTTYDSTGTPTHGGYVLVSNNKTNTRWKAIAHASQGVVNGVITTNNDGMIYINVNMQQAEYEYVLEHAIPQLEAGTQATPYTPYGCIGLQIGETVTPIDLQGHTLASLPDGTRDVLRVDSAGRVWIEKRTRSVVFDGVNRLFDREYEASSTYKEFSCTAGQGIRTPAMVSTNNGNLANMAVRANDNRCAITGAQGSQVVYWRIPIDVVNSLGLTSTTALNTFLQSNPLEITGKLTTPETIELGTITPPNIAPGDTIAIYASLDPEWAISYEQDPNIVVNALQSSIAPVEGATASANYSVGAYLMHGNQLYRVTSAIATGEAIAPGSNCVACTVMGELVRLTA